MLTMNDVVKNRQAELVNEVFDIETRISDFEREIEKLKALKEQRMLEYKLMESFEDRSLVVDATSTRKRASDRLSFEDTLIQVSSAFGRPVAIREIIAAVEKFGYQWSSYQTAYAYITSCDLVTSTGQRGMYNILAKRGW